MVPAAQVGLDAWPVLPNGKLDRRALPEPDVTALVRPRAPLAPRDALETQMVAIWEHVLQVRPVGVQDNFFDLGGHSLLAIELVARVRKALGREPPLLPGARRAVQSRSAGLRAPGTRAAGRSAAWSRTKWPGSSSSRASAWRRSW